MTESQARDEICRVGQSLFDRGYVHATAGNISVRLEDGYLITPTDACLGHLDPAHLSKVGFNLQHISGAVASKTIAAHATIYSASRQFDALTSSVIHTHSTYCVAQSLAGQLPDAELLPAITPYFVMKVGHVPHIAYHRPGDPALAHLIAHGNYALWPGGYARSRHHAGAAGAHGVASITRCGHGGAGRAGRNRQADAPQQSTACSAHASADSRSYAPPLVRAGSTTL